MKVLMTGATGFIGRNVLKYLLQFAIHDIIVLSGGVVEGVKTIPSLEYTFDADYLAENGCEDVEVLLHIGAFIPKSSGEANNIECCTGNIINTQKLLLSELPDLKQIIYISTVDVYKQSNRVITECTQTIPSTMYGWSKLYCEQQVINYCMQRNIEYKILRLGHVYGEGEEQYRKVIPVLIRNAILGEDLTVYGKGQTVRTFIYIDDVVKAIVNSLFLKGSEIINIAGDEKVSVDQLAIMIQKLSNNQVSIRYDFPEANSMDCIFDNSAMKKLLLKNLTPFSEGLQKEYEYMQRVVQ